MSEVVINEDLNEAVEEEVDDSSIITVPIDTTLTHSGEAADAKTVGDALALKANRTEIVSITVNGKSKDANNNIALVADDIPTGSGEESILDWMDGLTAEDIPISDDEGAQSIAQVIEGIGDRDATDILMSSGSSQTISDAISAIDEEVSGIQETITEVSTEMTDAEVDEIFDEIFNEE